MKIRADVNMSFYTRFLLIGLVGFGYGLWSLRDAAINYPVQRERAHKYEELEEENPAAKDFLAAWSDYATSQGFPPEYYPGEPKSDWLILYNYVMAVICTPLGVWLLVGVVRARGRWIEGDDSGVRTSWGPEFTYDSVTRLEKRKWKNKGIARVYFDSGDRKRQFVIDDFKFKRQPTDAILRQLESKIQLDLITGGPPEPTEQELEPQDEAAEPAQ